MTMNNNENGDHNRTDNRGVDRDARIVMIVMMIILNNNGDAIKTRAVEMLVGRI